MSRYLEKGVPTSEIFRGKKGNNNISIIFYSRSFCSSSLIIIYRIIKYFHLYIQWNCLSRNICTERCRAGQSAPVPGVRGQGGQTRDLCLHHGIQHLQLSNIQHLQLSNIHTGALQTFNYLRNHFSHKLFLSVTWGLKYCSWRWLDLKSIDTSPKFKWY